MNIKHDLNEAELISLFKAGKTVREVALLKGCPKGAVRGYADRHGLKPPRDRSGGVAKRIISPENEDEVRRLYLEEGLTCPQIGRRFGTDQSVIYSTLRRLGVTCRPKGIDRRQYDMREDFFSIIDTEVKAYYLGLIYADGSVRHGGVKNRVAHVMNLSLHEEDGYMVESLRDAIYPNRDKPLTTIRNQVRLGACSKRMVQDLYRLGCVENKTFNLSFPTSDQVPSHLIHHFIRGYFDGDGTITWNTKVNHIQAQFNIIGTPELCDGFVRLVSTLGLPMRISTPKHSPRVRYATASKQSTLYRLYHYMYRDATIYLTRKRLKYERLLVRMNPKHKTPL